MALAFRRSVGIFRGRFSASRMFSTSDSSGNQPSHEEVTHTGQQFEEKDYRRSRFEDKKKLVNQNFSVKLVHEDPIVVCSKRVVYSDGGGPLGHPRVFLNLDPPEVHTCGYSGRRFILKKYYDASEHGPCITYDEYLAQVKSSRRDFPN